MSDEFRRDDVLAVLDKLGESDSVSANLVRSHLDALDERIEDLKDENRLEEVQGACDQNEDAIHKFLDVVERPLGTLNFKVPETGESSRAIRGLYDAVNRNL